MQKVLARSGNPNAQARSVDVPHSYGKMRHVWAARRANIRAHIMRCLTDDIAQNLSSLEHVPQLDNVLESGLNCSVGKSACATCCGKCCTNGGDTGFVCSLTLDRVACRMPDLTQVEILTRLMCCVTKSSYAKSFVFHTRKGCALDWQLRTAVCIVSTCLKLDTARTFENSSVENEIPLAVNLHRFKRS